MTKINVYSEKSKTQADLPKELAAPSSEKLLAQAMHVYTARSHKGLAYAKTRAQVNITKKKIYRQKGTGGARHGAKSAPIFVGGGVAHGPVGKTRVLTLPKAFKGKAAKAALDLKLKSGAVAAIKDLSELKKTKQVAKALADLQKELAGKTGVSTLFVLPDGKVSSALKNIANSSAIHKSSLNAHAILKNALVVFDSQLIEAKKPTKQTKK